MSRPIILIFLFLLLGFHLLPAQTPYFKTHKPFPGKKTYMVNAILQDTQGFIWFGTSEGLVRYNGYEYSIFTISDSLSENHVTSLAKDKEGRLWIGHYKGGITIFEDQQFIKFAPEEGLGTKRITQLFIDRDNQVWFSTYGEGIYCFRNNRLYNLNTDDGLADDYTYCLAQDSSGNIWVGSDLGISICDYIDKSFINLSSKDGLPDNLVKHLIYQPESDDVWIGMEDMGIAIYNQNTKQFSSPVEWMFGSLNSFAVTTGGEVWVSTATEGIVRFIPNGNGSTNADLFTTQHGLVSNKTYDIFVDRESNVWVGCYNGITQNTGNKFEFLTLKDGLPGSSVNAFLVDKSMNYWVCTEKGLFVSTGNELTGISFTPFFTATSADQIIFTSLYEDQTGYIWTGTYGFGAYMIDPESGLYSIYDTRHGLANNNVISISGKDDKIVFSTLGGGISLLELSNSNEFHTITTDDGLGSNYVYASYIDSKDRIWIAQSGGGISLIEESGVTTFGEDHGMNSREILNMIEDEKGNLWFITPGQGLIKYDGEKFHPYNENIGLLSNDIRSIAADDYNRLVFTSEDGITSMDPDNMHLAHFGSEIGLSAFDPKENAVFKDNQGSIWIGLNDQGLIKYNPEDTAAGAFLPVIRTIRKRVYANDIPEGKSIFRYKEKNFTFNWIGFWYRAPELLKYRHKLNGHDLDWSNPSTILTTTYSSLQPGHYTFQVQAALEDSNWISSEYATYSFRIKPPFWLRWWFFVISGISIVSLVITYIKRREYQLIREKNILEEKVRERTVEVVSQKEEIEMHRDEIEAQRDLVTKQRDVIELKNKNITDSILYASRIQTAVLPPCDLLNELLPNNFIINNPKDIVSGDFYWLSRQNEKLIFSVADCTGHGVPGAFMSMLGMTLLNEIVNRDGIHQADIILNQLRNRIKIALRQTGKDEEAKDGMDIALCVFDMQNRILQYAGAFNPLFHVQDREINLVKADRMPIGIHLKDEEDFTLHEMNVSDGDMIYLFSDGYQDQFGGDSNKKYSTRRFHDLLFSVSEKDLVEQKKILEETLILWQGNNSQVDDIILLGVRF